MRQCRSFAPIGLAATIALIAAVVSCAPDYRPVWLGGTGGYSVATPFVGVTGATFSEVLLDSRTLIDGQSVTTATYNVDDMGRHRIRIDFNGDGKTDPVIAYGEAYGVIQILLSQGAVGTVDFISLTLDGGDNDWNGLSDVAVADFDGDGNLDIVAATSEGLIYLRHPSDATQTHDLRSWGQESGDLELIEGTTDTIGQDEQLSILTQLLGPGADAADYDITVEQGYTDVEVGDFDNDGDNDIAAARHFNMTIEPQSGTGDVIEVANGSIQILFNPGGAPDGQGWTATTASKHERHSTPDREGAHGLWAADLDGDGDLDLISAAEDDANVQVAWFENPGGPGLIDPTAAWEQYRIGSIRGAYGLDVADLTGDGQLDVVVTGTDQMQIKLFVQPPAGPKRTYDWDGAPIVTFESYAPRDIKALDVDADGTLELVVGGTNGAVRYFEPGNTPTGTWTGREVTTFDPAGDVGLLGYGDLDGDLDLDLIAVIDTDDDLEDSVVWVRNELY